LLSSSPNLTPYDTIRYEVGYIMVVDDEYDIVQIIKRQFERDGIQTCIFTNPSSALLHFNLSIQEHHHHHYHPMVISDIRIPAMNGYEFIKQVKELDPNARIILMSSLQLQDNEFLNVLPKVKIDQFVQKPFAGSKLTGIVKKYVKSNWSIYNSIN
jgi:DNA-binding NtrC family response regulator